VFNAIAQETTPWGQGPEVGTVITSPAP